MLNFSEQLMLSFIQSIIKAATKYCLLILLCILAIKSSGQEISELNNYILGKDKNAVDKALEKIKEAGELTQEANNYYNEALELQSDYELDEKTLQKKIAKAENNALSAQMQADKIYSGAYQSLRQILLLMAILKVT